MTGTKVSLQKEKYKQLPVNLTTHVSFNRQVPVLCFEMQTIGKRVAETYNLSSLEEF